MDGNKSDGDKDDFFNPEEEIGITGKEVSQSLYNKIQ